MNEGFPTDEASNQWTEISIVTFERNAQPSTASLMKMTWEHEELATNVYEYQSLQIRISTRLNIGTEDDQMITDS